MAKTDFKDADEYITTFPEHIQATLKKIRQTVQEAVPDATEVISYQLPAFKYHGMLVYYSAYKAHFGLSFPPPFTVFEKFQKELSPYEVSKSAIRFPMDQPFPYALLREMVLFRAKENIATEKEKKKK